MSVRWHPLLSTHAHKRFWKFCITHCIMVGKTAATSSLMFCFKSTIAPPPFFFTPCSWDIPSGRSRRRWAWAILHAIQYSLFVRSRKLGTSGSGLALQSSQCEPSPCLDETRESGLQHQVSATLLPEMCISVLWAEFTVTALPASSSKKKGPITPKDATPHQTVTFSEGKGF